MTCDRERGLQRGKYPLDATAMARSCRKLAADLRREAAAGMGPVPLANIQHGKSTLTRAEAAASMDRQAERWAREAATGELNVEDRRKIGF